MWYHNNGIIKMDFVRLHTTLTNIRLKRKCFISKMKKSERRKDDIEDVIVLCGIYIVE